VGDRPLKNTYQPRFMIGWLWNYGRRIRKA